MQCVFLFGYSSLNSIVFYAVFVIYKSFCFFVYNLWCVVCLVFLVGCVEFCVYEL